MSFQKLSTLVAVAILSTTWNAAALLLVKHEGATHPATEGFTVSGFGGTFTTNALAPDGATGFDAWEIGTFSPSAFAFYQHTWTPSELTAISTLPRLVQMRLRVVDPSDTVDSGMMAFWSFGGKEYFVGFGSDASGDPIVGLGASFFSYPQQYTVTGAAGQYVLYELEDDNADGTFRLFVNRTDTGLLFSGATSTETRVGFGDGSGSVGANGHVNWNLLLIDVPEPGTAALAAVGVLFLLRRRWEAGGMKE